MVIVTTIYVVLGLISMLVFAVFAAKEETSRGTLGWIFLGIIWAILLTLAYVYIYSHIYLEGLTNLWLF